MSIDRVFLDWKVDQPVLHQAARWLIAHARSAGKGPDGPCNPESEVCDLSGYLLAVTGGRAQRRLLEILLDYAGDQPVQPPTIITAGDLPEYLYQPAQPLADDLLCRLAWVTCLRKMQPEQLQQVIAHPPEPDAALSHWLALASDLHQLRRALAADGKTISEVGPVLTERLPDFTEKQQARWHTLGLLENEYLALLARLNLSDTDLARRQAIESQTCRCEHHLVLIGLVEMNRTLHHILQEVGRSDCSISVLIHAPAAEAESFDALGTLRTGAWKDRPLSIDEDIIHVVDRPRDQAMAVLQCLEQFQAQQPLHVDEITVGLGETTLGLTIHRSLELMGIHAHLAAGRPLSQMPPVMLLDVLGRFSQSMLLSDFASLLRHPDMYRWLQGRYRAGAVGSAEKSSVRFAAGVEDWLSLLDEYATQTLHRRLTGSWLGNERYTAPMKRIYDAVLELLPADAPVPRPIGEWSQSIADALSRVYEQVPLQRHHVDDEPIIRTLQHIAGTLKMQASLTGHLDIVPHVTFGEAVRLAVMQMLNAGVPMDSPRASVELLGWLELPLDDAPVLILTGVNEGHIPQSRSADPFLPDRVRQLLGLADNEQRYARDRFLLESLVRTRRHIALIAGRRDAQGNPLRPSRLLLTGEGAELSRRILHFYPDDPANDRAVQPTFALFTPGTESGFTLPLPDLTLPALQSLRVTAFRDYLACPYRFYLRHVLKLESMNDAAVEMDGGTFGHIAHDVLRLFAQDERMARSTDGQAIADFLCARLDETMAARFGAQPAAALIIQHHQLRERLQYFAQWQALQTGIGWRIVAEHIERSYQAPWPIDEHPFTITGKIDRIDLHDELGYRIIDYKTSDSGEDPDAKHRAGAKNDKHWVDLQLPLYYRLAASAGIDGEVELGYILLPKDLAKIDFVAGPWSQDELLDADNLAEQIIRDILAKKYWPPADAPIYDDGFAGICMDACLDRNKAIAMATEAWNRMLEETGGDA